MACAYSADDLCVAVNVDVQSQDFGVDGAWMAGAFFLGLVLGALITALCARPCVRDLEKKKVNVCTVCSFYPSFLQPASDPAFCSKLRL